MPMDTRALAEALPIPDGLEAPSAGATRGALFRVAYKILGNRLGSAWVRRACERDPGLAEVLRPTVQPLGWYPIERLIALLHTVPAGVRDPHKVARELGRAIMTSTFARFYGADPSLLSPDQVLSGAEDFWARYHSWGRLTVQAGVGHSIITITDTPREPLVCCLVEGTLERIAELAGGSDARAVHTSCETQGAAECTFEISWSNGGQPS